MDFEVSEIADESVLSVSVARISTKIEKKIFVLISLFWKCFRERVYFFRNFAINLIRECSIGMPSVKVRLQFIAGTCKIVLWSPRVPSREINFYCFHCVINLFTFWLGMRRDKMSWSVMDILCNFVYRRAPWELDLSHHHMTAKNLDNNKNIEEEDQKIAKRRNNCCSLRVHSLNFHDPLVKRKFLSSREFKRFPLAAESVVQVASFSCELWLRIGGWCEISGKQLACVATSMRIPINVATQVQTFAHL